MFVRFAVTKALQLRSKRSPVGPIGRSFGIFLRSQRSGEAIHLAGFGKLKKRPRRYRRSGGFGKEPRRLDEQFGGAEFAQPKANRLLRRCSPSGEVVCLHQPAHHRPVLVALGLLRSHEILDAEEVDRESIGREKAGIMRAGRPVVVSDPVPPQSVIDRARWGIHAGNELLGAADYKLVHHASNGRAVYSFCMCPGGTVVAATSEPERVVTNGMSQYSRNERNANAGIVVGIHPADYPEDTATNPLAGVILQRALESHAYVLGGKNYCAPAQLVGDFLVGKPSTEFGEVIPSYKPGVTLTELCD